MRSIAFLFLVFLFSGARTADDLGIRIAFETLFPEAESNIVITDFKCYLSAFELHLNDSVVWQEAASFHLLDMRDPASMEVNLPVYDMIEYDAISFTLGVDSITSVSGAYGGDLDPTKGMYWTWNSGYINFKLEGTHPDSPQRQKAMTYHLGGYLPPHATARKMTFEVNPELPKNFTIDLNQFLAGIDVKAQYKLMSIGEQAAQLSDRAAAIFQLSHAE